MAFQLACDSGDLEKESALHVELQDQDGNTVEVAVVKDEAGIIYAVSDICSHGAVSLSQGEVEGCFIECWLHGSSFDLRNGKPAMLPATKPIPVYPVKLEDTQVFVDVDNVKEID